MKILVTLDGSTFSEAILAPVIQMAESTDAEVHLLTVVEEPGARSTWLEALAMVDAGTGEFGVPSTPLPPMSRSSESGAATESDKQALERALNAAEEYLTQIAGRFSSGRAKTKVITGEDPVKVIMDFSLEQKIDLIAMSTHGRSGLGRWVYGSTADKLLHSTSIPLLLMRPSDEESTPQTVKPIDTLVIPLDGSEMAESALAYGEDMARKMSLNISLIRVVSTPALAYPGTEAYAYDPKMFTDLENAAVVYLKQKQAELEQKASRSSTR
ncbi:MAG: universal stress protein [Chloroflexi bacterium]|nr:universal stress protein [Chloroflexota bacterium]